MIAGKERTKHSQIRARNTRPLMGVGEKKRGTWAEDIDTCFTEKVQQEEASQQLAPVEPYSMRAHASRSNDGDPRRRHLTLRRGLGRPRHTPIARNDPGDGSRIGTATRYEENPAHGFVWRGRQQRPWLIGHDRDCMAAIPP